MMPFNYQFDEACLAGIGLWESLWGMFLIVLIHEGRTNLKMDG